MTSSVDPKAFEAAQREAIEATAAAESAETAFREATPEDAIRLRDARDVAIVRQRRAIDTANGLRARHAASERDAGIAELGHVVQSAGWQDFGAAIGPALERLKDARAEGMRAVREIAAAVQAHQAKVTDVAARAAALGIDAPRVVDFGFGAARALALEALSATARPDDPNVGAWLAADPDAQRRARSVAELFACRTITSMTISQVADRLLATGDAVGLSIEEAEAQRAIADAQKAHFKAEEERYQLVERAKAHRRDQELRRESLGRWQGNEQAGVALREQAIRNAEELRRQEDQLVAELEAFEREQSESLRQRMGGGVQP